jgi:hypothetical protein
MASSSRFTEIRVSPRARDKSVTMAELARRVPGALFQQSLVKMRGFLTNNDPDLNRERLLEPIVTPFVQTMLLPSWRRHPGPQPARNRDPSSRILRALAGEGLAGCALLCQRMKAVESVASEDSCIPARYIEVVPDAQVSTMGDEERTDDQRQQQADARLYGDRGSRWPAVY